MTQRTIGGNLSEIMKRRGISAQQLGKRLAISRNRIGAILRNETKPDYFTMKALRKALDIPPGEAAGVFFPGYADEDPSGGRAK